MLLKISKKYLINTFYIIIIIMLSYFIYKNVFNKVDKLENENYFVIKKQDNEDKGRDQDNDGLEDWEEDLYGTDKYKKDSDNDGISDFDEIKNFSDPLTFGQGGDDYIEIIKDKQNNVLSFDDQREELRLNKIRVENQDNQVKDRFSELEQERAQLKKRIEEYYKNNEDGREEYKVSFNLMGKILNAHEENLNLDNDKFDLLFSFTEDSGLSLGDIQYFKDIADKHMNTSKKLSSLKIDNNKINFFKINLVSFYEKISFNIIELIRVKNENVKDEDEKKILQIYIKDIEEMNLLFSDINEYLVENNIKFQLNESGKYFMYNF